MICIAPQFDENQESCVCRDRILDLDSSARLTTWRQDSGVAGIKTGVERGRKGCSPTPAYWALSE